MGYRVLDSNDTMRGRYGARKGLEGPFNFSGRILYYDPRAGQYYDPTTDFYVDRTEMDMINVEFYDRFTKECK